MGSRIGPPIHGRVRQGHRLAVQERGDSRRSQAVPGWSLLDRCVGRLSQRAGQEGSIGEAIHRYRTPMATSVIRRPTRSPLAQRREPQLPRWAARHNVPVVRGSSHGRPQRRARSSAALNPMATDTASRTRIDGGSGRSTVSCRPGRAEPSGHSVPKSAQSHRLSSQHAGLAEGHLRLQLKPASDEPRAWPDRR